MSDIAFSVIVNNNGIDDIVFKTIMLKGDKGNSVDHISKTSTSGLVDTYTIYLTDGTIGGTFTVTNGSPVNIDDTVTAIDKTWSSSKLSGMIKSIDDNVVDADKLWSSQKINSMLAQTGTIEAVSIASFSDGADDVPLSELTVDIDAWQEGSGEPSPSNVRAIHGWNECNIIKSNKNLIETTMNISCAIITNEIRILSGGTSLIAHLKKGKTYTISGLTINRGIIGYFDSIPSLNDESTLTQTIASTGNPTFTADYDGLAVIYVNNGTVDTSTAQLELGSTATSYVAHDGGTDTIDLTETIYGGTLNVSTGVLTITHGIVDLGNLDWIYYTTYTYFQAILPARSAVNSECWCDRYVYSPYSVGSVRPDKTINTGVPYFNPQNLAVTVKDSTYTDATTFKTAMSGAQLVYELATPTTIQLTPTEVRTLLGANNIFADTGDVEKIVYFKTGSEPVARMIEAYMRAQPVT